MKKLFSEPLLHFLLIGAVLFIGYRLANSTPKAGPQQIVVSPGQIEHMVSTFGRAWQRPPNADEIKGLIDQYVREEVLSREAMKLGLDKNDVIIRRRLQQKMEFIASDILAVSEPTEADLAGYLAKHPESFRQEPRLTFRQIYLNPDKRGEGLEGDAARMLADLTKQGVQAETSELGDPSLLPQALAGEPQRGIENSFGSEFAAQVAKLPVGEWCGPIQSGIGVHLVLIEERTEGRISTLAEVRPQVQREWENERRIETNRKFLDDLLKHYAVTIEWPKAQQAPLVVK